MGPQDCLGAEDDAARQVGSWGHESDLSLKGLHSGNHETSEGNGDACKNHLPPLQVPNGHYLVGCQMMHEKYEFFHRENEEILEFLCMHLTCSSLCS